MDYKLSINNKRINDFYYNNNLNFELFNILLIDILEKIQDISVSNLQEFLEKKSCSNTKNTEQQPNMNIFSDIVKNQYENSSQIINEEKSQIIFTQNNIKILLYSLDTYDLNITNDTITQFINDCENNKSCGILFSQHSGIINKNDYEIQILNKNVILYIHNTKYNPAKIKMGITIVTSIKTQIDLFLTKGENNSISNEILDSINNEYLVFKNKKEGILKSIKENNEIMEKMLDKLNLPNLESYLSSNYSSNEITDKIQIICCQYCKKIVKKSILQHYRNCKSKIDTDVVFTNEN